MILDLIKKTTINIDTIIEEVVIFSNNKYVTKIINKSDLRCIKYYIKYKRRIKT